MTWCLRAAAVSPRPIEEHVYLVLVALEEALTEARVYNAEWQAKMRVPSRRVEQDLDRGHGTDPALRRLTPRRW